MRTFFFTLLGILLSASQVFAQNTVGVLSYDPDETMDGYNLFYPHNQSSVYLLDNCGRVVHSWEDSANFRPGNVASLLPNGNLVKTKRTSAVGGSVIWAGGGGETVEIRDWVNRVLWSFSLNDSNYRVHHDVAPMPNGNILMIVWDRRLKSEVVAAGRDTAEIPDDELWSERIIEVKPIGADSFDIVWEWFAWDHLIQDFDSTQGNYGKIEDHPELIDLNYLGTTEGEADWLHFNSIDFNEDLNQVLISVPEFNEMWIIDHSTTTAQAATSTGGLGGRGGNLLFRWGNPLAYGAGDSSDMKLFYQHDAHWVDQNLNVNDPDFGKIMVFNNRVDGDHSEVHILEPLFDTYEWEYIALANNTYAPAAFDWTYVAPTPTDMYSTGLSGAQKLANGHYLICSGRQGWAFEVDDMGQIVWQYVNPLVQGSPLTQGDPVVANSNLIFRFNRYPPTYGAFSGRDLSPGDYLELNPDTTICPSPGVGIDPEKWATPVTFYPNPASQMVIVETEFTQPQSLELFNLQGQKVRDTYTDGTQTQLSLQGLPAGMYMIRLDHDAIGKLLVK